MISHHPVKIGGHRHCGSGDITFLVVEEQDSTCSLKFFSRGHSHIESSHSLCQIDASGWVGLALQCLDFTHEILIFVKIPFN